MDNHSDMSSILSFTGTQTSSSTVPGLGSLSGKAIKKLGEAVLNGVDNILVNRQLTRIEARLRKDGSFDGNEEEGREMCRILLELSHPGYPFPVQTRALRMIMQQIGSLNFKSLATALVATNSSFVSHRHISGIIECLWCSQGIGISSDTVITNDAVAIKKIAACQAAGYEAYMASTSFISRGTSDLSTSCSFILYLAYLTTISSADLARIILELNIAHFLDLIGLFDRSNSAKETIAGRLLLHTLALKLDPIRDSDFVDNVKNRISLLKTGFVGIPPGGVRASDSVSSSNSDVEDVWTRLEASAEDPSIMLAGVLDAIEFVKAEASQRMVEAPPSKDVKVLLLGAGECGKTTIMKQLVLSHRGSEAFISQLPNGATYREEVVRRVVSFLHELIDEGRDLTWAKGTPVYMAGKYIPSALISWLQRNVQSMAILQSLAEEATSYQLDIFTRFQGLPPSEYDSYEPTEEDLLRWYITTTGVHEEIFETPSRTYHMWDCGGQRPERKKWVHIFKNVNVLLCVVSLVDYDQYLAEDHRVNRMQESLTLFDSLVNSRWFIKTQIVLILTKRDCLAEKLVRSPLVGWFPSYTGGADETAAFEYIKERFVSLNQSRPREKLLVYTLNANRTEEVKALFENIGKGLDSVSGLDFPKGVP